MNNLPPKKRLRRKKNRSSKFIPITVFILLLAVTGLTISIWGSSFLDWISSITIGTTLKSQVEQAKKEAETSQKKWIEFSQTLNFGETDKSKKAKEDLSRGHYLLTNKKEREAIEAYNEAKDTYLGEIKRIEGQSRSLAHEAQADCKNKIEVISDYKDIYSSRMSEAQRKLESLNTELLRTKSNKKALRQSLNKQISNQETFLELNKWLDNAYRNFLTFCGLQHKADGLYNSATEHLHNQIYAKAIKAFKTASNDYQQIMDWHPKAEQVFKKMQKINLNEHLKNIRRKNRFLSEPFYSLFEEQQANIIKVVGKGQFDVTESQMNNLADNLSKAHKLIRKRNKILNSVIKYPALKNKRNKLSSLKDQIKVGEKDIASHKWSDASESLDNAFSLYNSAKKSVDDTAQSEWFKIMSSDNIEVFRRFINKYPGTMYIVKAENRIKNIKAQRKREKELAEAKQKNEKGIEEAKRKKEKEIAQIEQLLEKEEFNFVLIKPGTFMMGSPSNESSSSNSNNNNSNDEIQHRVTLTKGFYMQTTEVTQGQWKLLMGKNPSYFKECGDNCPVENVSWIDIQGFIKKLNRKTGKNYRLPTEAEWEYAARSGTTTPFNTGKCLSADQANYDGNYPYSGCSKGQFRLKTISVAHFSPNAWGLYDMHGNVWEWCQDWKGDYPLNTIIDPTGPSSGLGRVGRGGSFYSYAHGCRSAHRSSYEPTFTSNNLGFRLVISADK